jgi:Terminase RNaseH-like domain
MAASRYLVGIDVGQTTDPSAVLVLEHDIYQKNPIYLVRAAHRYPLGTRFTELAADILDRFTKPPFNDRNTMIAIDATGVGLPVVELIKANPRLWQVYAITITGATAVGGSGYTRTVPKRDLITTAAVLFQQQRIRIAAGLPDTPALIHELLNFRVKTSDSGHKTYEAAGSREHDDLVLALSLALWTAEQRPASIPMRIGNPAKYRIPTQHDRFSPFWP